MATTCVLTNPSKGVYVATWASLANGQSGDAAELPVEGATRSVQISGTFGSGGNILIEGSNDGSVWATLMNTQGTALGTITSAAIHDIAQNTRYIRPRCSAGDGTTAIKITLLAV